MWFESLEFSLQQFTADASLTHTHTHHHHMHARWCLLTYMAWHYYSLAVTTSHVNNMPPPGDASSICLQKSCLFPSEKLVQSEFASGQANQQLFRSVCNCDSLFSCAQLALHSHL